MSSRQTLHKILILLAAINCCCGKIEIEKYLKICDRNSPDIGDCLVDVVTDGLAKMTAGIPDLGVPPIDPYHQEEIRVEYRNNQILVKMNMKDIYVEGLKAAKVHDARLHIDDDSFHMEVDLTSPFVNARGKYSATGSFNALKIDTVGEFNCSMQDLVYTWKLDGVPEKRDGETYIRIKDFYMRPDVGNLQSYASNVFPDNKDLTKLANDFANENWKFLYRELLPYAQANWNKIGIRVANKVFLKVPIDKLFPASS